MEILNTVNAADEIFSIEQLESRFEMLAVPPPNGGLLHPDWTCTLTFNSAK